MPQSSWAIQFNRDGAGAGSYSAPTVNRNFTSISGTALTLPSNQQGSTPDINIAMRRALNRILNAQSNGTYTLNQNVTMILTNDGSGNFTATAKYNGAITGGTAVTVPTLTKTSGLMLMEAYVRGCAAVRNDRSNGN